MESRTANLVLRLLQRHLPVPLPAPLKHANSHLPGLLPRVPFSVQAGGKKRLLDASRNQVRVSDGGVERTRFGAFFQQPNSPFLSSFEKVEEGSASPEPAWRFKLGLRLKSGMYMPTTQYQEEEAEEGWQASSVKRKRKKKMNKHKQRKLRRRDRHRN